MAEKEIISGPALKHHIPAELGSPQPHSRICVNLGNKLFLSDRQLNKPLALVGEVGSGKSFVLMELARQISKQLRSDDTMVIFTCKDEIIRSLYQPGDVIISYAGNSDPRGIYNLFAELRDSPDPEMTLRQIVDILFVRRFRNNTREPFFVDGAVDLFTGLVLYLLRTARAEGWEEELDNALLLKKLGELSAYRETENGPKMGWEELVNDPAAGMLNCAVYIGNTSDLTPLTMSVLSQLRTMVANVFIGSFAAPNGRFSTADMLRRGGRLFLLCDYAEFGASTLPIISCILNSMMTRCLAFEREAKQQRCYFILDEFSFLENLDAISPASGYGRAAGFRLIYAVQSLAQLERNMKPTQAKELQALTGNFCIFQNRCHYTRDFFARHYGTHHVQLYDPCGKRLDIIEEPVIGDEEFQRITGPGDCIMAFSGISSPFMYYGHDPDIEQEVSS